MNQLIDSHNSQVDAGKRFVLRKLDLSDVDTNNNIVRANKNYPTSMQEIKDKVIKLMNAYVSVEDVNGTFYLDCSQNITHYNQQDIRLGENIIDLTQVKYAGNVRTVMIGIGAEDKYGNRLEVTVENRDAIAQYGRIVGTIEFDDVTTMRQLEKKTKAYLDSVLTAALTVEVTAMDLSLTDSEIEQIELGYCYVESKFNNLDHVRMLVSKLEIHLTDPGQNVFTIGTTASSMTTGIYHTSAEIDRRVKRIASSISPRIQYAVENATQLITGAQGGYVILDCGENADGHPEQILIMDAPDKNHAVNVIRINKNGIGFSTTGYNGPYANAWTIDGNLVADFITTGTMFADRIRGGTLEAGGEKDGIIRVLDQQGNTLVLIDKEGIIVYRGSIRGSTITVGGSSNSDGKITVLDSSGRVRITIDVNGINVNDKFKVGMDGNMEAISISGNAINQISDIIDASEAMKMAKKAIKAAKDAADAADKAAQVAHEAADAAQRTANTANNAASTAQNAANTANNAASTAQSAANQANALAKAAKDAADACNDGLVNLNGRVSALESK